MGGAHQEAIDGRYDDFRDLNSRGKHSLEDRVVGERGDGGGLLELNEVPVGVELIGEHLREGCTHALTHLSMGHYGRDDVIRVELYPLPQRQFDSFKSLASLV